MYAYNTFIMTEKHNQSENTNQKIEVEQQKVKNTPSLITKILSPHQQTNTIRLETPKNQPDNLLVKNQSKDSSENCEFDIFIEASEQIPESSIISFLGEKHYRVKIVMYNVSTFLKMQTQNYVIDVEDPYSCEEYQIKRRFSDFFDLYQSIFYNHPGHILAPFPDKNLETFFKVKLGIGISQASQKSEIIEKRMGQLQNFINFITHHSKLCKCEEINIFLEKQYQIYLELKATIQQTVNQNQALEKVSYMSNLKQKGKSLWGMFRRQKKKQYNDTLKVSLSKFSFTQIQQTITSQITNITTLQNKFMKLYTIQLNSTGFVTVETQNDVLLSLFAKHNSCQQYRKGFANQLCYIADQFQTMRRSLKQAQKVVSYRQKLIDLTVQMSQNNGPQLDKLKIENKIKQIEHNFLSQWQQLHKRMQDKIEELLTRFHKQWKSHKKSMKKVWKE